MDPMCPLPKKGEFLQGHTWTDCNYVLLTKATQFRTLHEGDKPFLGYTDLSCFVAVWGRGWCISTFQTTTATRVQKDHVCNLRAMFV